MKLKFKNLAEQFYSTAIMQLAEVGGVRPIFFLVSEQNDYDQPIVHVILADFSTDERKAASYEMVRRAAIAFGAHSVVLVSEAWTVTRPTTLKSFLPFLGRPSEQPDRKEVLQLICMESDGKAGMISGEIEHDIKGTPFVRDYEWFDSDDVNLNLLDPWKGETDGGMTPIEPRPNGVTLH